MIPLHPVTNDLSDLPKNLRSIPQIAGLPFHLWLNTWVLAEVKLLFIKTIYFLSVQQQKLLKSEHYTSNPKQKELWLHSEEYSHRELIS